jgi:hypothetical protein
MSVTQTAPATAPPRSVCPTLTSDYVRRLDGINGTSSWIPGGTQKRSITMTKRVFTIMGSASAVATVVGTCLLLSPTAQATPICNSSGDCVNLGLRRLHRHRQQRNRHLHPQQYRYLCLYPEG